VAVLSLHLVLTDKTFPLGQDGGSLVEDVEHPLELTQFDLCLGDVQSEPILARWPGGGDPEFVEILRDQVKDFPSLAHCGHGVDSRLVHRVVRLRGSGQDVGVEQGGHSPRPS
jgi:hypothetical protein